MRTASTVLIPLIALTMIVAACGGSSGDDQVSDGEPTREQVTDDQATDDQATEESANDAEPGDTQPDDEPAEADVAPIERPIDTVAVDDAEAGVRPLLSWSAVDGAALYRVVVVDGDGAPYWAWSGSDTEVFVGGVDDATLPGAVVSEAMTWSVAALDADGLPLALSDPAPLQP